MKRSSTFKLKLFWMFTALIMGASLVNSCNTGQKQEVKAAASYK